jgi:hypothetical protein
MHKTIISPKLYLPLLAVILITSACKKLVDVEPPRNEIVSEIVFSDSSNATAAVTGIYINIMNSSFDFNLGNGILAIYSGMSADELYPIRGFPEEDQFFQNNIQINPDNYISANFWQSAYKYIYQTNACLEGLEKSTELSERLKKRLIGETKILRAYLYFNLINLFGDAPLVIKTDFHSNSKLPRTPVNAIYTFLIDDLNGALALLQEASMPQGNTRPGKFAALTLLARIYLHLQKWTEAEQASTIVINSNNYALEPNLDNVFLPNSKEAIWQITPVDPGYNTPLGAQLVPTPAGRPRYGITDNLLACFEASDLRPTSWIKQKTVNSIQYSFPFKYKLRYDGNPAPSEVFVPIRLAELYLIRSEARAELNQLLSAKSDLNTVRSRAGIGNSSATTQSEIIEDILLERQRELFCEEGHRWFDLKRTGRANIVLAPVKLQNWQETDQLYPIPFEEIRYNPALVQNPGY